MAAPELRIGLCGVGLDAYWPQFSGLRERLDGYVGQVAELLKRTGASIEMLGLVDTPKRDAKRGCVPARRR